MAKAAVIIGIGLGVVAVAAVAGVAMAKSKSTATQTNSPGTAVMLNTVQLPSTASGASDAITKILGTPTVTTWAAPSGRQYTVMEWHTGNSVAALLYTATPNTLWAVQVITGQLPIILLNVLPDVPAQNDVTNFVATQLIKLPTGQAQGPAVPAFSLPTDPVQVATILTQSLGAPISTASYTGPSNRVYTITQWKSAINIPGSGSVLPQNTQVVMIFGAQPFTFWVLQISPNRNMVQLLNIVPDSIAQADIDKVAHSI